ncbi:hypothetical protein SAMN04487969_10822 [Paenibacillus algorifonticola]|uniref:Uncharacterized protein n=1 Tax=Paenibacillus algorifonticola TaxID=684063 RepID=A0A1I2DX04_9BACL|nr:hypothetical protein [Paenibacillus algorifonticola]SFE85086.1 hypothetical protein SAMN04487969_10822 [Paenibacillus algorifonticola]
MLDFSFEMLDEHTINVEYVFGSEKFIFNLFYSNDNWTIHPFDGILLKNRDLCRSVMSDLFQNKSFQIMLAKENIILSSIRSSVNLNPYEEEEPMPEPERLRGERYGGDGGGGRAERSELDDFINSHTLGEILELERSFIEERTTLFKSVLQKMFMDGLGPGDSEFNQIQELVKAYKRADEDIAKIR